MSWDVILINQIVESMITLFIIGYGSGLVCKMLLKGSLNA